MTSSFHGILETLESEVIKDYMKSIKFAIVDNILLDPAERTRLRIEQLPIHYPVLLIRAPVPWHQSVIRAKHYNDHNLFIGNEILRDIRDLWFSK